MLRKLRRGDTRTRYRKGGLKGNWRRNEFLKADCCGLVSRLIQDGCGKGAYRQLKIASKKAGQPKVRAWGFAVGALKKGGLDFAKSGGAIPRREVRRVRFVQNLLPYDTIAWGWNAGPNNQIGKASGHVVIALTNPEFLKRNCGRSAYRVKVLHSTGSLGRFEPDDSFILYADSEGFFDGMHRGTKPSWKRSDRRKAFGILRWGQQ